MPHESTRPSRSGTLSRTDPAPGTQARYFLFTINSFSTPETVPTSRALTPARVLSDSLSTTPTSVVFRFLTMMWIG